MIWNPTEEEYQELERRGRDVLRTLGWRRDQPSPAPEFPLESEDRRLQRLLDRFAFHLDWPEERSLGPKFRRPYAWKKVVK